jgi:curved DNA-binding protein CbpA
MGVLLRPFARPLWTCPSCLHVPRPALFHSAAPRLAESTLNHYETLQVAATATTAEIKRQFYALSKKHHPDRNKNDPDASTRFVKISEAYHTLSAPDKRTQYDAQLRQSEGPSSRWGGSGAASHPQGSYSSAGFAGSRPASGLNKRRTTFRGPPPSFYKSGGYGNQGAKRAEHAEREANEHASYGDYGGFGPGQQRQGKHVPHFDDIRHKETHEQIYEHIQTRRRRSPIYRRGDEEYNRGGMLANFLLVSSAIGLIGLTATFLSRRDERENAKRREGT